MNWLANRRRGAGKKNNPYLMTRNTNPEVLAICYAQGWCASPDYMTYEEALNVKDIGRSFENSNIVKFKELKYFGITSLSMYSFNGAASLTEISLPNSVTTIGSNAFYSLTNLEKIELSNQITTISSSAFYGCNHLQYIEIPSTITSIGTNAFRNCSRLSKVTVRAINPPTLGNSYVFNSTGNCPIYVPAESVTLYKGKTNWTSYSNRIQAIPT